jgi:predicted nucleic acid-binding protein
MAHRLDMSSERIFLDTAYIQALLNGNDSLHSAATRIWPRIQTARETIITEAIIVEVCNALAGLQRETAVEFVRGCYRSPRMTVIEVNSNLLQRAVDFYAQHRDKNWGLTDCISFVVMRDEELSLAATADRHFLQAGFSALLLEP